jgi:uncharacterized protein (DUF1697 family)
MAASRPAISFVMKKTTAGTAAKSTYIALLRGINLGGHKIVKMEQLRKALAELGFEDVKTYIQSGNVVFRAPAQAAKDFAKNIEEKVQRRFGFPVAVQVKTAEEVGEVIRNNSLAKEKGLDPAKLHVTFLSCAPEKNALKMLDAIAAAPDQFRCSGQAVYLHCPNGYHETKVNNNVLEKMLKVGATTRNWKTVNQLYRMTEG